MPLVIGPIQIPNTKFLIGRRSPMPKIDLLSIHVELWMYLAVGLFMFTVGTVGVIMRRNPIVIFMCIELMLNAVNLTFLAFARYMPSVTVTGRDGLEQAWMGGQ